MSKKAKHDQHEEPCKGPECPVCHKRMTAQDKAAYEFEGGEGWPEVCEDCGEAVIIEEGLPMNTKEWIASMPKLAAGTRVRATASSISHVRHGTEGEVVGTDPDFKGYFMVRFDGRKFSSSVPWDTVEVV